MMFESVNPLLARLWMQISLKSTLSFSSSIDSSALSNVPKEIWDRENLSQNMKRVSTCAPSERKTTLTHSRQTVQSIAAILMTIITTH